MLQNHVLAGRTSHKIALHYIKTTIYHETRLNDALKILCNNTPKKNRFFVPTTEDAQKQNLWFDLPHIK
jgi:competence transcription factor ComK